MVRSLWCAGEEGYLARFVLSPGGRSGLFVSVETIRSEVTAKHEGCLEDWRKGNRVNEHFLGTLTILGGSRYA